MGPSLLLTFHWLEPSSSHAELQGSWKMESRWESRGKKKTWSLSCCLCRTSLSIAGSSCKSFPQLLLLTQSSSSRYTSLRLFPHFSLAYSTYRLQKWQRRLAWLSLTESHLLRALVHSPSSSSIWTLGKSNCRQWDKVLGKKGREWDASTGSIPRSCTQFIGKKMVRVVLDYNPVPFSAKFLGSFLGNLGTTFNTIYKMLWDHFVKSINFKGC